MGEGRGGGCERLHGWAEGWSAGADAYLTKPVHLRELRAVLESLVQRHARHREAVEAAWTLDVLENRLINPQGAACEISFIERSLLLALVASAGKPVERATLVEALGEPLWAYDMRRLEAACSRLRKKFSDLGSPKDMVRPVRGIGYLLAGRVKRRGAA